MTEKMNIIGVRADGSSELLGTAPISPALKRRDIVANFFEQPTGDENDCSDANSCLWALEEYHCWLVAQGWTPPAIAFEPKSN